MENTHYRQNISVQYCFPENNSSCRKEVRTGPGYIILFIFLSCVSVCTVFLNLLVIISISHFKQLHTPTNLLILSLAVADLLVGLFVMPVKITQLINSCWYLGNVACAIFPVLNDLSLLASLYSLVFIAVDRYIAVCDPLLYSTRVTVPKATLLIILNWSLSSFYLIMGFYFNDQFNLQSQISTRCYGECVVVIQYSWVITDMVISFLAPCCIILVLYLIIFHVARRQAKAVRAVKMIDVSKKQRAKASSFSQMKAAKKLGTVIFIYLTCWIPFYLSSLTVKDLTSSSMIWNVFGWLIYMNSSVNPLLYAFFYPWFRTSAKVIIACRIFQSSSSRLKFHGEDS